MPTIELPTELLQPLKRVGDADGYLFHWTGGMHTGESADDRWHVLPVLRDGKPCIAGYFSRGAMQSFMHERGLHLVAIEHMAWMRGEFHGHWAAAVPGRRTLVPGPPDLWSNIARNLAQARMAPLAVPGSPPPVSVPAIFDAAGDAERLARSISLSLRNLDSTVRQITEYYSEELTNGLAAGHANGQPYATTRDQAFYALVHGFFLHLGSVRDYLATFIAVQLGLDPGKIDSMARLVDTLRGPDPGKQKSALLALLVERGDVLPVGEPSTKWKLAGWLEHVTDLRNEFVHRRTYGQKMAERTGRLVVIDEVNGIYRYFRALAWAGEEPDAYDVIVSHYVQINTLLFASAECSGHDVSTMTLTDKDVISTSIRRGS